jgi:hypothetical protein
MSIRIRPDLLRDLVTHMAAAERKVHILESPARRKDREHETALDLRNHANVLRNLADELVELINEQVHAEPVPEPDALRCESCGEYLCPTCGLCLHQECTCPRP